MANISLGSTQASEFDNVSIPPPQNSATSPEDELLLTDAEGRPLTEEEFFTSLDDPAAVTKALKDLQVKNKAAKEAELANKKSLAETQRLTGRNLL